MYHLEKTYYFSNPKTTTREFKELTRSRDKGKEQWGQNEFFVEMEKMNFYFFRDRIRFLREHILFYTGSREPTRPLPLHPPIALYARAYQHLWVS